MAELSIKQRLGLELQRQVHNILTAQHPLRQLFWECTQRCNLHCRHCGSDCKKQALQPDMPAADFLRVLDSVAAKTNPHKVFVVITGGEPLMRDDLEEVGRAIYERGFPWGIVTNGLALTRERFSRLRDAGMHTATVSLDGFEDDHNWMRGNKESFNCAIEAIKMMVEEKGFVFDVVTCVNRRNYQKLNELKEFLIGLGLKRWRIFTVFPVGRAGLYPDLQLKQGEFEGVMNFIRDTRREGRISVSYGCEGFLGRYEGQVRDHLYACNAGVTVGSVLIDGSISACPSIRANYSQGNIYKDDFMEVWQTRFQPFRQREWMRKDECQECKFFRYCRGGGMHLRGSKGNLLFCHLKRLQKK